MFTLKDKKTFLAWFFLVLFLTANHPVFARVLRQSGNTYIVDLTGYKWEITQALSLGFEAGLFRHGIGKNAFRPLNESDLSDVTFDIPPGRRVIGVTEGDEAQAYSVPKLVRHEIANSSIDGDPIAVGY